MNNFTFMSPTLVEFGKGSISKLSDHIPNDASVMIVFGSKSVKENGVYEQVKNALSGFKVCEFWGIEPNPQMQTCLKAVTLALENGVNFLLSVGGGSVLDATKFISVITKSKMNGENINPADIVQRKIMPKDALPLGAVMTLPATGSEMNGFSVISIAEMGIKMGWFSTLVYPEFSIIDPESTFSLPIRQTRNGIIDSFVHTLEQYATIENNTPVQDGFCFSVFKAIMGAAPKVLNEPKNYEARANMCWAATCALNGWCRVGMIEDWSSHAIGHELSALYGLDHGGTLAIVSPRVLRFNLKTKETKLAKMGREVFGLSGEDNEVASECIDKIYEFFKSTGIAMSLAELNIDKNEAAAEVSKRFKERNLKVGETGNIDFNAVKEILLAC